MANGVEARFVELRPPVGLLKFALPDKFVFACLKVTPM
jgi:hypothetical protein